MRFSLQLLSFILLPTALAGNIAPALVGTWSTGNGAVLTGPVSLLCFVFFVMVGYDRVRGLKRRI